MATAAAYSFGVGYPKLLCGHTMLSRQASMIRRAILHVRMAVLVQAFIAQLPVEALCRRTTDSRYNRDREPSTCAHLDSRALRMSLPFA